MSPRARVALIVAAVAVAVAVGVVGVTAFTAREPERDEPGAAGLRPGRPPLLLDLGVRRDAEAAALRRGAALFMQGQRGRASAIFERYDSLEAETAAAMAAWPEGTSERLEVLARRHPRSAVVRVHLGLARYWERDGDAATEAWRAAERLEPDSPAALQAENFLHPQFFVGRPIFVPSFEPPRDVVELPPDRQLRALERAARSGGVRDRLLYGVALQRVGRPVTAARVFSRAAADAPADAEAQVAAAVAAFDKDEPERAFSRLGPLARRFPRAATVRFHLGLLLLWIGSGDEARNQLVRARQTAPESRLGREADRLLRRLAG